MRKTYIRGSKGTSRRKLKPMETLRSLLTEDFLSKEGYSVEVLGDALALKKNSLRVIVFDADAVDIKAMESFLEQGNEIGIGFLGICKDAESCAEKYEGVSRFVELLAPPKGPKSICLKLRNIFLALEWKRKQEEISVNLQESLGDLRELNQIGIALSAERNIDKLLELIVERARYITRSDAGSIYIMEPDEGIGARKMRFKVAQNDSLDISFSEFTVAVDKKSISGYVAATGQTLNIEDVYFIPPDREYGHNKSFDERNGYRSKSMLTVPMKNRAGEIIGVLQLMNRKKDRKAKLVPIEKVDDMVLPYSPAMVELVESLASQAAVSLENAMLYEEIQNLFESFVKASVTAIESRDPTTHGHSNRVATLTVGLAIAADKADEPPWREVSFSRKDLKEIEYAGLLHDFGKIGVREEVLVKAKKLYPWDWEMLRARFEFIQRTIEKEHYKRKFEYVMKYGVDKALEEMEALDKIFQAEIEKLKDDLAIIEVSNLPTVMPEGNFEKLKEIAAKRYEGIDGTPKPFLTEKELFNLSLPKGSLNDFERREIESHVTHTFEYLTKINWGKSYKNVPTIAYAHHEKLNGKGYPRGLTLPEIPLQSRMMTIADIYDALTASDRPYKKAVPVPKALEIIEYEVKEGMLDPHLFKLFVDAKIYDKAIPKASLL